MEILIGLNRSRSDNSEEISDIEGNDEEDSEGDTGGDIEDIIEGNIEGNIEENIKGNIEGNIEGILKNKEDENDLDDWEFNMGDFIMN